MASVTFRFGDYELDSGVLELRKAGRRVAIEPTPLRVLLYLIQERRRVVRKDDLRKTVWRDVIVGDAALAGALRDARRAVGDNGAQQRWIRTRQRVGYQFVGKVDVPDVAPDVHEPAPLRLRLHGAARSVSSVFTGRAQELAELEDLLTRDTYWSPQVSIEGLAGIGKTELALQLVHKLAHQRAFPGGIFWLDAIEPDLRATWGALIADQLGLPFAGAEERSARVLEELERRSSEPILVVLDNAESWAAHLRSGPLPLGPHVRVLVTTRQRNFGGARFAHVALRALTAPHDRELLERVALRRLGSEAEPLLARLGGHPLALELAGAFLGTYVGESAAGYLTALAQDPEAPEALVKDRVGYNGTVAQAFSAVCKRLSAPAREAWWLASFFEPEPVTRQIADACGIGRESLRALEENHLIQSAADGTWTMHLLTREFGARLAPDAARALELLEPMTQQILRRNSRAAELRRVYETAGQVLHAGGESVDRIVAALERLWHERYLGGDGRSSLALAHALEELARSARSDMHLLAACAVWSAMSFNSGRLAESTEWTQRGLELCDTLDTDHSPALRDRRTFLLLQRGMATFLLGYPTMARHDIERTVEHAAQQESPARLDALLIAAHFHFWRREWTDVVRMITLLTPLDTGVDTTTVEVMAAMLSACARLSAGERPVEPLLATLRSSLQRCRALQMGDRMSHIIAETYLRLQLRSEAREAIEEGLALGEQTGERLMEPELWRHRAAIAEAPDERKQCLEQALALAAVQGNRWASLRAATDLVLTATTRDERPTARARLQTIYDSFYDGFELQDLHAARAALEPSG